MFFSLAHASSINEFNPLYLDIIQHAENKPQEALKQLISINTEDFTNSQKAEHLFFQSIIYGYLDYPNKMLESAEKGLSLIDKNNQTWLYHFLTLSQVDAWDRNGIGLKGFGEVEAALDWSRQNDHLQLQLNGLFILSNLYIQIEDYYKALSIIQEAYQMAPEEGPFYVKADFSSQMAAIYVYRGEFEIALPFLVETYEYQKKKNNELGISIGLYELGRAYLVLNQTEKGIAMLEESIERSKNINDIQGIAYAQNELANQFLKIKAYDRAESLLLESIRIFNQSNNTYMLFDSNIQLSMLYAEIDNITLAEKYLEEAKQLIDPKLLPYSNISTQKQQAAILAAKDQYMEAYELLLKTIKEQQELEAKQSVDKLHQIRAMYELEANNAKNALLNNKNQLQRQELDRKKTQNIWLILMLILAVMFMIMIVFFMLKFKKQAIKLHNLANYDELTGLRNRSNTIKSIKGLLSSSDEAQDISLIMIDLDHFKSINDQFGHALGDKVLSTFGQYCKQVFGNDEIIGRVGGEEFLICLKGFNLDKVYALVENLRLKTASMHETIKAPGLQVSLSAGLCVSKNNSSTFHQLLKCADHAMYQAKHAGRNQIVTNKQNL